MCKHTTYKHWTRDEEAGLERLLEKLPPAVLAHKLGRSETSIRAKARRLQCSIQTTLDNYSLRYLATSLGVNLRAVQWWVAKDYLTATQNGKRRKSISALNFARFCQERPDIVSKFDSQLLDWLSHKHVVIGRGRPKL
jgi:hypothetical protein